MKKARKILVSSIFALALCGGVSFSFFNKSNKTAVKAVTEEGYTIYHEDDLGFATRDSGDTRVVKGDVDGGMQTKGAVLADKSELQFTMKKTFDNYWIGVGGYAVYVSSSTTIRFLYLGYNSNGAYGRNAEKSNLVLKTADGATALTDAAGDGKLFTNYTKWNLKIDLTNYSAAKLSLYVEYEGVKYYPFESSTKIESYTFSHTASGFADGDKHRAMAGANATDSGVSILKFNSHVKSLDNIIDYSASSFTYSYINNFFVDFSLTEKIFTDSKYFNDHINEFLDASGNPINIGDGILINGQTFNYWRNLSVENASYPRNDGVTAFPLNAGGVFNPVSIEVSSSKIAFKVNLDYIPMDGMVITFKAGVFAGYNGNNGTTFVLNEDMTFYSVVTTSNSPARVTFVREQAWEVTGLGSAHVDDWGEKTASQGGKFREYAMWTNIPRDASITQGCPADNYRYMYGNILMNGKPLSYYHAWARGNSKDFTDLASATQNPDYELGHPTGGPNINYDLAIRISIATDQPNYVLIFDVPNQLVTDLSLGALSFTIRDGSDWLSVKNGNTMVYRYSAAENAADAAAVQAFATNYLHMSDYNENLGYCADNEHGYYLLAKQAYNQLTDNQKLAFQTVSEFAGAKARFEKWAEMNADAAPYDGNDSIVTLSADMMSLDDNNEGNNVILVVIISMTVLPALAALLLYRKKARR